ncbi:hypothetical protein HDU67_009283 [Dinochytrium kinnereticum]|nr:hypothetical protein HDU67_009283 [Dinochytrium kinnereticum]
MIESNTPRKALLGKRARLMKDKLIKLLWTQTHSQVFISRSTTNRLARLCASLSTARQFVKQMLSDGQEKAAKEVKSLKQRVELLEKENAALKKSLYDLSARFNMLAPSRTALPLMLDSVDVAEPGIDSLLIDSAKTVSTGEEFSGAFWHLLHMFIEYWVTPD